MKKNTHPGKTATLANIFRIERRLFEMLTCSAGIFWLMLTLWSKGMVLVALLGIALLPYLLNQALTSHFEGHAIRIGTRQFPDLHVRLERCCRKLGLARIPPSYLVHGDNMLQSLAMRLLRHRCVTLRTEIVDALDNDPDAIDFYLGRELCHVARPHGAYGLWVAPALLLPLLGNAYRRAREYTGDRCGLICCRSLHSSIRALSLLAAGPRRWQNLDAHAFIEQAALSGGFWMSLQELTDASPWLCKRMARLPSPPIAVPRHHPLACLLAALLPSSGLGGLLPNLALLLTLLAAGSIAYFPYPGSTGQVAWRCTIPLSHQHKPWESRCNCGKDNGHTSLA